VDAVSGERFVEDSIRSLTGVTRFFRDRNISGVLKIAQQVKQQFDDFRPKVPLLVALRKPGMVARHWKAITDNVGFEVNPQIDNFTFERILDLGLMKNIDFICEVGEKAAKEYQIETMLDEMESKWETISF
jgi:dynein heavy chain, axonemal